MRIASITILLVILAYPSMGFAQQWLTEQDAGAPFQLATQRQIGVSVLPYDSQAGFALASVMPQTTAGLDVVEFKWPKSNQTCQLGIGQTGHSYGQQLPMPSTYAAVQVGEGTPRLIPGTENGLLGVIARVCVWATTMDSEAQLVFLFTCSEGPDDSEVRGFVLSPDGIMQAVNTQHAKTLYGWFECGDLDGDGTWELVTSRNLDASPGGFFYHAVRSYDPVQNAYVACPEDYKDYFSIELEWLNWVLETRDLIQANPHDYMSEQEFGHIYTAKYEGVSYGFDSIIELPNTFAQVPDIDSYNRARREAYHLIKDYRDQLSAWLDGTGSYPDAWKLPNE